MKKTLLLSVCILGMAAQISPAFANDSKLPTREEMWKMIQAQQKQIEALQEQVSSQNQQLVRTEAKIDTTQKIAKAAQVRVADIEPAAGGGHSHGHVSGWADRTSIGGYGELHYNGGSDDEIDLHRFVIGLHHEFNEDMRLVGEIEHALAGDNEPGEVEIEQAYVEFDLGKEDAHQAKLGVFLMPIGILNETHEPPTFFGVERNPVENNIIPTTWWEGGGMLSGRLGQSGFSYDIAAHSGLQTPANGNNAYRIRNGRQKVAEAEATDLAYTGRLTWTGYPGVELGLAGQYQSDISQNANDDSDVNAYLVEAHADIRRGGWGLRALYAEWNLDGDAPEAVGRDEQYGWYIEPSYRFDIPFGYDGEGVLGVFGRYNKWDNNAGVNNSTTEFDQTDVGVNYWPTDNIVVKADMAFIDGPTDATDDEVLNLGVGWQF